MNWSGIGLGRREAGVASVHNAASTVGWSTRRRWPPDAASANAAFGGRESADRPTSRARRMPATTVGWSTRTRWPPAAASVHSALAAGKAPTALRLRNPLPLAGVARYQCGAMATVDFPRRPIRRIHPSTHRAMKGGIRTIHHASDVAVLERVDMDVIRVTTEILFIADLVLPVAPLPDAALIAQPIRQGTRLAQRQASREVIFQYLPAHREVGIARWQRPQAVHMVRQHHPGIDTERMAGPGCAYRLTQKVNMPHQQIRGAIPQIHGEEIGRTRRPGTAIVGH